MTEGEYFLNCLFNIIIIVEYSIVLIIDQFKKHGDNTFGHIAQPYKIPLPCSELTTFLQPIVFPLSVCSVLKESFLLLFAGDNVGWADLFGQMLENANPLDHYYQNACCKCVCLHYLCL